jgi:transposase
MDYLKDILEYAKMSLGYQAEDVVLIFDNAGIHKPYQVQRFIQSEDILTITIPPYQPELNQAEYLFRELKNRLRPDNMKNK